MATYLPEIERRLGYVEVQATELYERLKLAEIAARRLAAENQRLRNLLQQAVDFAADYKLYRDWVWKSQLMLDDESK